MALDRKLFSPAMRVLLVLLAAALVAMLGVALKHAWGKAPSPEAASIATRLDRYLTDAAEAGFSGSILVARKGEVVLYKGYGLADRARKTPITRDTVFDIGSITKQFTAAAILKLEMQGKLRVTDPISRFFRDVPADKQAITLHHLLTHTAGLPDVLGGDYEVMTREQIVRLALATPLRSSPGESYAYSNVGYSLLGAVVEIAGGQAYEHFLREHLLLPAGLQHTGYMLAGFDPAHVAHGYRNGQDWGTPTAKLWDADGPYWNLRANGGLLATLCDLHRWHLALEGERVLSAAAKQKMFTAHVPEGPEANSHYGYGWTLAQTVRDTRIISHNGGNSVFFADFRRYVDEGVVIVIASNTAEMPAHQLYPAIPRIIFEPGYTPPQVSRLPRQPFRAQAARYAMFWQG